MNPKNASPVVFSHEIHVKSRGIKCTACHYQIFQMSKGSSKIDMSMITKGTSAATATMARNPLT
ncbi:MAG: cytochrome c3 family protein [Nitrospirota bacterium]|nr:cytochrome c3 family protein [Nitrospirota bacterium]